MTCFYFLFLFFRQALGRVDLNLYRTQVQESRLEHAQRALNWQVPCWLRFGKRKANPHHCGTHRLDWWLLPLELYSLSCCSKLREWGRGGERGRYLSLQRFWLVWELLKEVYLQRCTARCFSPLSCTLSLSPWRSTFLLSSKSTSTWLCMVLKLDYKLLVPFRSWLSSVCEAVYGCGFSCC